MHSETELKIDPICLPFSTCTTSLFSASLTHIIPICSPGIYPSMSHLHSMPLGLDNPLISNRNRIIQWAGGVVVMLSIQWRGMSVPGGLRLRLSCLSSQYQRMMEDEPTVPSSIGFEPIEPSAKDTGCSFCEFGSLREGEE